MSSCGNGPVITASPRLLLIGLSSLVSMKFQEPKFCTNQEPRANASSFYGWLYMIDVGRLREGSVTTFRTADSCALCDQESESIDHLLLGCSFARELWFNILLRLRWHFLTPGNLDESLADWWSRSRKRLQKADRKCFDSLVILTSWMIWKERNARIFDSKQLTVAELLLRVKDEADVWLLAGFKQIGAFPAAFAPPFGRSLLIL